MRWRLAVLIALALTWAAPATAGPLPEAAALDARIEADLASAGVRGLGAVVIDGGQIVYLRAFGVRNDSGAALRVDSVMYGASLTKVVFAYVVMQLVDEGRLDLDASIATLLPKPLPDYPTVRSFPAWHDLAGDERWRQLTPRILLSHRSGFANFHFLEPDGKLRFHFEPGARYAYSGDGLHLLQFVLEEGLRLDVAAEIQRRVFDRFGMVDSSMTWSERAEGRAADGFDAQGRVQPHARRSRTRVAGSMDTTPQDFARFAAGFVRGDGLSSASRREMAMAQWPIGTAHQFPTLLQELPLERRRPDLATGLGLIAFSGPQGPGFYKGGHDDITGNTWVCVERGQRCVVLLSNDVRAESLFPGLVAFILGKTGAPWQWEYGVDGE